MEHRRAVLHIYNSINRATYEQYLWRVSEYVVDRYIDSALAGRDIQESDRQIIIHYYTCTCFGVVSGWLENGMKDDLRQPFHRICELEKGFIEEILRRSMDA